MRGQHASIASDKRRSGAHVPRFCFGRRGGHTPPMAPPEPQAAHIADRLALALLAIAAIVALATFRDYGLGWDDYTHAEYGDLLLSLYASGFADQRALSLVNLYEYGGGFDLAAALLAKVLPFSAVRDAPADRRDRRADRAR